MPDYSKGTVVNPLPDSILEPGPTYRHKKRQSLYAFVAYGVWIDINDCQEDGADLVVTNPAPGVWLVAEQLGQEDGQWARLQTDRKIKLGDILVIYRALEDNSLWARPRDEFEVLP